MFSNNSCIILQLLNYKKKLMKWSVLIIISFFLLACNTNTEQNIQGEWIKGTEAQQLETIEKQFRGFDNTMVEVGYRYKELYWAGQDKNWEYANYQLEKIKLTIENMCAKH